ncbi:MAG: LarC family nickel insertion protein, partial [Clostridia bacterium]
MKTLYFECRSGISGDMCVASLLDLGVPYELVERELLKLATTGYVTEISDVKKNGIRAVKFDVRLCEHVHSHNCARDILNMIEKSLLNSNVKRIATDIFTCIARAEAKIHGVDAADVHFHEVGAVDSIVDIVATAICIDYLAPERIVFSEITEGTGFVNCEHGVIPVPAPAT